jgi:hypothetical protein
VSASVALRDMSIVAAAVSVSLGKTRRRPGQGQPKGTDRNG